MEKLNILEKEPMYAIKMEEAETSGTENNNGDAEIVYDYSSDENPFNNPYNNYGIKRKETVQDQYVYGPPSLDVIPGIL